MKRLMKRMTIALFAGALLIAPAGGPFQLAVNAAESWDEMSDQEKEALRKENADGSTQTPSRQAEAANARLPRYLQGKTAEERAATTAAASASASTTGRVAPGDFASSSKVPANTLMAQVSSYAEKNGDVVGWLYVPNTNINEPIVLNAEQANAYYETRTWDGTNYPDNNWTNYRVTATFADRRVKLNSSWGSSSRNIVLYGHNWTNLRNPLDIGNDPQHVMFGQLPSYTNQQFAQSNPYIYFSTDKNEGIWKVFAAFYCEESSSFNYNSPNPAADVYASNLADFRNRSIYDFSTEVNANDHMITLSTCTRVYGDHAQQRFVVMARLLREGESDTDAITVSVNADMKKPAL